MTESARPLEARAPSPTTIGFHRLHQAPIPYCPTYAHGVCNSLMRIAQVRTLAVQGEVSEIEVGALAKGQVVEVNGQRVPRRHPRRAARAGGGARRSGAGGARFTIRAEIESLDAATREALRIGMSTETTIVVRDDPAVIVAPIEALRRHEGGYAVEVANVEATRLVPVETGATTAGGGRDRGGARSGTDRSAAVTDGVAASRMLRVKRGREAMERGRRHRP